MKKKTHLKKHFGKKGPKRVLLELIGNFELSVFILISWYKKKMEFGRDSITLTSSVIQLTLPR